MFTFIKLIKITLILSGLTLFLLIFSCFTNIPSTFYKTLKKGPHESSLTPEYIVVLGGGGIPSESGLMRTYAAATLNNKYPHATFIVCLPTDEDSELSHTALMKKELVMRGVAPSRVLMETKGRNTYEESAEVFSMVGNKPVMIVSSNYHIKRSVMCFQKAGFSEVCSYFNKDGHIDADMGKFLTLRYGFWQNLNKWVWVFREYTAIIIYKVLGRV